MFKFKKPKRDVRFLDPEIVRHRSSSHAKRENLTNSFQSTDNHLKVNFLTGYDQGEKASEDSWITVAGNGETLNQVDSPFLKLISGNNKSPYTIKNNFQINDVESITLFDVEESIASKKIGVFSDSKIYSALIQSLLNPHELSIGHFNHPNTFVAEKFTEFDEISAWIIFLSDEDESDFLDQFLNRYENIPTLFLFPKMKRANCQSTINEFIREHGFIATEVIH